MFFLLPKIRCELRGPCLGLPVSTGDPRAGNTRLSLGGEGVLAPRTTRSQVLLLMLVPWAPQSDSVLALPGTMGWLDLSVPPGRGVVGEWRTGGKIQAEMPYTLPLVMFTCRVASRLCSKSLKGHPSLVPGMTKRNS